MSPTEFDLRSALRDGEGDEPNADRIIGAVDARRATRRSRLLTAAASVVLVGAIGTGGAYLLHGSSDEATGGGAAPARDVAGADANAGSVRHPASAIAPRPGPTRSATSTHNSQNGSTGSEGRCPATFPRTLLPGGGSPGQFGSDGPLFTAPVATVVVCTYGADGSAGTGTSGTGTSGTGTSGTPVGRTLAGTLAQSLVDSLEGASKTRSPIRCPDIVTGEPRSFAFIGVTTSGRALRPVTTTITQPACNTEVTNGTAVRYNWLPSAAVARGVLARTPVIAGGNTGDSSGGAHPGSTGRATPQSVQTIRPDRTAHGSPLH